MDTIFKKTSLTFCIALEHTFLFLVMLVFCPADCTLFTASPSFASNLSWTISEVLSAL
jgi:hypothetical protein